MDSVAEAVTKARVRREGIQEQLHILVNPKTHLELNPQDSQEKDDAQKDKANGSPTRKLNRFMSHVSRSPSGPRDEPEELDEALQAFTYTTFIFQF